MHKVYLQLLGKNGGLFGERIELNTAFIPRVGELIDGASYLSISETEVSDFMVESVIYKLTADGFVPYITARRWYKGVREEMLQERGWLVGGAGVRSYDEDDPARCDRG